jgi:hypothetical protein
MRVLQPCTAGTSSGLLSCCWTPLPPSPRESWVSFETWATHQSVQLTFQGIVLGSRGSTAHGCCWVAVGSPLSSKLRQFVTLNKQMQCEMLHTSTSFSGTTLHPLTPPCRSELSSYTSGSQLQIPVSYAVLTSPVSLDRVPLKSCVVCSNVSDISCFVQCVF